MEEVNNLNSAEDIKKVEEAHGLAISMLGTMGNNDWEVPEVNRIYFEFLERKIPVDVAVEKINQVVNSKQTGAM